MNKYIIMGPQGSGKGTQAKLLADDLKLVHISVGDIFRWNIQAHTKLAARIKRIVDAGGLVSDEIVEQIVRDRLDMHDWNYGFILDGFPRSESQASFFLESYDIDAVIYIDVPDDVVVNRALARRICSQCGLDYNLIHHRPEIDGVCDVCGGTLVAREDDTEESLKQRLHDFTTQTKPTLDLFERKELVVKVDGQGTPAQVQATIRGGLGLK
ncbi:MAG: nucleoside monophosphate kinase [Planctomycetales bacterium]|nr:nucleoside monophosphate kinase [Planctomycetales bacterium]